MTAIVKKKILLTVPDAIRRRAGFKPGDRIEFKASRGVVTIVPKRPSTEPLTMDDAKKVRHALKQVRAAKTLPWSRVKDELGL